MIKDREAISDSYRGRPTWTFIARQMGMNSCAAAHELCKRTQKKIRPAIAAAAKEAGYDIDNTNDFRIIARALSEVLADRAKKHKLTNANLSKLNSNL